MLFKNCQEAFFQVFRVFRCVFCCTLVGLSLGGCATLLYGTEQIVTINTEPSGASCDVYLADTFVSRLQEENFLGNIYSPDTIKVPLSSYNFFLPEELLILCAKEGYRDTLRKVRTQFNTLSIFNLINTLGWFVDFISGAIFTYPEDVTVQLRKP